MDRSTATRKSRSQASSQASSMQSSLWAVRPAMARAPLVFDWCSVVQSIRQADGCQGAGAHRARIRLAGLSQRRFGRDGEPEGAGGMPVLASHLDMVFDESRKVRT